MTRNPRGKLLQVMGRDLQRRLPKVTEDIVAQCRGMRLSDMEALYQKRKTRHRLPNG